MVKSISRINLNDDLLKSPSGLTYANRADSQSSLVSIDSIASIATPFESTAHGNTSIFTTPSKRKVPGSPANAFHSVRGLFSGKRRNRADTDHFNSSMVSKIQRNCTTFISIYFYFYILATEITSPTNQHKPQRLTFLTTQIARTMAAFKAFVHHQSITELVMDAALILICSIATIHITLRSIPSIHIPFCNKRNTHIPGKPVSFTHYESRSVSRGDL